MSLWQIFTSEYRISTRLILDIEYRISTRLILDIQNFFKKSFLALNLNVNLADFHIWISNIHQIDIGYWISNIHQIDNGYSKFLLKKSVLALNLNVTLTDFHIWISNIHQIDIGHWISNIQQFDIRTSPAWPPDTQICGRHIRPPRPGCQTCTLPGPDISLAIRTLPHTHAMPALKPGDALLACQRSTAGSRQTWWCVSGVPALDRGVAPSLAMNFGWPALHMGVVPSLAMLSGGQRSIGACTKPGDAPLKGQCSTEELR